ncbi:hypothetical protein Har1130_16310 [Haloarcula sp. CBA1130]|uniref:hypothetical protein n=1 Tax=unclassified Haloarcula TaxID=2624677 RepID=UPI001249005B|nr:MULTISPECIES: hypothetical protein [unclassified Haloarcula]KAA9396154.1 hypothetical protein Har1129_19935 [Haloarcula sp. CBA1129]KAA9400318.1 hypothetical protein Har1130_16310 [Haloarcula sp. CBA1130]
MSGASVADAKGFVYEPARGPKRRIEFEPRSDASLESIEAVWTGCRWWATGREVVTTMRRIRTLVRIWQNKTH